MGVARWTSASSPWFRPDAALDDKALDDGEADPTPRAQFPARVDTAAKAWASPCSPSTGNAQEFPWRRR